MKPELNYETLCIGSSPLCLLEALHQARAGRRILVAEEADNPGGAWREISVMGIRGAEIGPHVITFNAATYSFLQDDLGLEMFPLEPVPVYLVKTPFGVLRVPYHFAPFVSYFAVPYHFLANSAYRAARSELKEQYFGRLSEAVRLTWHWLFSSQKPRLLYPRGGTPALMRSILAQLESAGVELSLETIVHSLQKCGDGSVLADLGDRTIRVRRVLMTEHQHLDKVADESAEHVLKKEPHRYSILHLLIKSELPQRITFALAKRDPIFNRISKIAPYLPEPLAPGNRLLTVRLIRWDRKRDRSEVERFVRSLSEDVIAPDARLLDFQFSDYEQTKLTKESQARVRAVLGGNVTFLRSTSFANSIGDRVSDWRSMRANPVPACSI